MIPGNINRIRTAYRDYYHHSIDSLPDGWTQLIMDFLYQMDGIGDLTDSVSCRFERCPDGCKAFVFPEMSRWHPEQMNTLRVAQRELYGLSQQTCEVCGNPGAMESGSFLCIGHAGEGLAQRAPAQALYDECRILFPPVHGSSINLAVPPYLEDLLAKCLRDVKHIVEREGLVGDVIINLVEMREGMLFVWHRYEGRASHDIPAQTDIDDIMRHLQLQAEKLWLTYGDGNAS